MFITQKRKLHPETTSLTTLIVTIACSLQAWYGNNKHEYDERLSKFMLWSYCCSFASRNLVMRVIIMRDADADTSFVPRYGAVGCVYLWPFFHFFFFFKFFRKQQLFLNFFLFFFFSFFPFFSQFKKQKQNKKLTFFSLFLFVCCDSRIQKLCYVFAHQSYWFTSWFDYR